MNNGKVRIYELSKELNLDNRDILAVCDQLNISVKSHSSTITEAEAARIRTAAEKYTPSHSVASARSASSAHSGSTSKQSSSPPPVKKQQILEVRRHRPLAEPPKRPTDEGTGISASPAPAQPPTAQAPAQSATTLNVPNRPAQSAVEAPEEEAAETASVLEAPVEDLEAPVEQPIDAVQPSAPEVASAPEPEEQVQEQPDEAELIPPPARPAAKAPESRPSPSHTTLVNRPTLKRARSGSTEAPTAATVAREPQRSLEPAGVAGSKPAAPRRANEGTATGEPALKPKPVIELRRKPVRPGADGGTAGDREVAAKGAASTGTGVEEASDLELRRPTPLRPPKRAKIWEEEEEDEQEAAQKAGKVGPKSKRRTQPLIDDDEEDLIGEGLIEEVFDEDEEDDDDLSPVQVSLSLVRPPKPKGRPGQVKQAAAPPQPKSKRTGEGSSSRNYRRDRRQEETRQRPEEITLTGSLSVHDLAEALVVPDTDIIKTLFLKGIAANINQILDIPTAMMVAQEYDIEVKAGEAEAEARKVTEMLDAEDLENLQRRPPVVTIMGHVDHGKTTLLDSIRKTKVAQGEAGGITQHIGAYHVDVESGGKIQQVVFLDTPGHEAFTAMRARGARVTDIAILVVAADDGVRPQTIEAISHAKAAGVPIVVAINKIDKEEAQPDRVKQELTEYGLVAEEWGGDTIMVPVSAIKGENLDTLLEMILLVAEVEDLYANPDRSARGTVIEANLDKSRGPVATLIVQNGTLRVGDVLVAGSAFGKVRAMVDDRGKRVEAAMPSFAVEVLGLSDVPAAGDEFQVYKDEKEARAVASSRTEQQRQSRLQQAMASRRVSLNTLSAQAQEGELKELNLILKADVQGSVEAILGALQQLPQREVQVRVLLAAPGEITETDVDLAAASDAVIVGFNTTLASGARQAADEAGVDVRDYNIIYKLLEDIQGAMEGLLEPELVEEHLGQAEVRAVFPVGRGAVAGCYIQSGKMIRNSRVRVQRGGEVIYEGNLDSLKRMKDDVREVNAGYECGIGVDSFRDWEMGDIIEAFRLVSKRRTLSA